MPQRDPESRRLYNAAYYQAHAEQERARKVAYRKSHAAQRRAYMAEWRKAHPEAVRANKRRDRARKLSAPLNDFTNAQWETIKAQFKYRCAYCGKKPQRLTQDHITPLITGGSHTMTNIIPACQSCNSKKGPRAPLCAIQPLLY